MAQGPAIRPDSKPAIKTYARRESVWSIRIGSDDNQTAAADETQNVAIDPITALREMFAIGTQP